LEQKNEQKCLNNLAKTEVSTQEILEKKLQ